MKCSLSKKRNLNWTLHLTRLKQNYLVLNNHSLHSTYSETLTYILGMWRTNGNLTSIIWKWWTSHPNIIRNHYCRFLFLKVRNGMANPIVVRHSNQAPCCSLNKVLIYLFPRKGSSSNGSNRILMKLSHLIFLRTIRITKQWPEKHFAVRGVRVV